MGYSTHSRLLALFVTHRNCLDFFPYFGQI